MLSGQARTPGAEKQKTGRPKIGVALAGGAALGLAHVGVLRWLEEHRIPVDYIAGTSMGGLVGGLYATGRTAREMEDFVRDLDWDFIMASGPEFRQLTYRRKEDMREYPSRFEFGYKKGVKIPAGLSSGHGVGLALSRFTAPWGDLKDFDDLPTPFRCVATDLVAGKQVVFEEGPLYQALRATMSIPAVFTPVRMNGKVLVDGGAVNNLPVDVVRRMGADIVIAVTLESPPDPKEDYSSLIKVAGRSLSVLIMTNELASLAKSDIPIAPDLKGLTGTDYSKAEEFYARGGKAAEEKRAILEKLSLSEAEYADYQAARRAKRRHETVKPQTVEIVGNLDPERVEMIKKTLGADRDHPVDLAVLEDSMTRLTGLGRYEAANYEFIHRPNEEGLLIQVKEKEYGPPFLRVAFTLDGNSGETLRFGIGGRLTFLDVGGPMSEWRSDFSLGTQNRLATEYYYRIRGGRYFVAPRLFYDEGALRFFSGGNELAEYSQSRGGGGIDLGYNFGRFTEIRFGYRSYKLKNSYQRGIPLLPDLEGRVGEFRMQWVHEGQNSPLIPTNGTRIASEIFYGTEHPDVSRNYPGAEGEISFARPLPRKFSYILGASGAATINEPGLSYRYTLGGPGAISSLSPRELFGNRYYRGSAFLLRSLNSDSLSLFGKFYGTVGYEMGRAWIPGTPATPRHSGSIGLSGETPFGVLFFGGAFGDQGDKKLFFRLGRIF